MKPTNSENQLFERLEQLENRCVQLETTLVNDTVTFETLSTRLISNTGSETKKS